MNNVETCQLQGPRTCRLKENCALFGVGTIVVNVWKDLLNQYHGKFSQILPFSLLWAIELEIKWSGDTLPSSMSVDNLYSNVLFGNCIPEVFARAKCHIFLQHITESISEFFVFGFTLAMSRSRTQRSFWLNVWELKKGSTQFFAISSVFASFQRQVERQVE